MAFVDITSALGAPGFGHAWRAKDDGASSIHATMRLGDSSIHFDSPAEALALATAALTAYQALTRLEADPELGTVQPADLDVVAIGQAAWGIGEVLGHAAGGVDSQSWQCSGCGGWCIDGKMPAGLCRGCEL